MAELYEHSVRLFSEKGFAGTSFQDIADSMRISRPALYHYVSSKEDLLERVVGELSANAPSVIRPLVTANAPAVERLRNAVHEMAFRTASHPNRFLLLLRVEHDLPNTLLEIHVKGKRELLDLLSGLIAEGVGSGEFRRVHDKAAAFAIIGMSNWLAWWYQPGGELSPEDVACELAELAVRALAQDPANLRPRSGVQDAMGRLEDDLAYLKGVLARPEDGMS